MRKLSTLVYAVVCLAALTSCSVQAPLSLDLDSGNCFPPASQKFSFSTEGKSAASEKISPELQAVFSPSSLSLASSFGMLQDLEDYLREAGKAEPTALENRLRKTEIRQNLNIKLQQASLQISSFVSQLDCEREKLTQVADYMKRKEDNKESALTVAAIAVGAVGATASGVLIVEGKQGNALDYIGAVSGVVEAALGTMIFLNNKKIRLSHHRNVLRALSQGNPSFDGFPEPVWNFLTQEKNPDKEPHNYRDQLIAQWKSFEQIKTESPQKKQTSGYNLFFGNGGIYTTEEVYNRAQMLGQLQAMVQLMIQDLSLLTLEIPSVRN